MTRWKLTCIWHASALAERFFTAGNEMFRDTTYLQPAQCWYSWVRCCWVGAWGTKPQTWPGRSEESKKSTEGKCALIICTVLWKRSRTQIRIGSYPEMEFLDINLTKSLESMLYAIQILFYWRIFFFGLKNLYKKICETRKLEFIHE